MTRPRILFLSHRLPFPPNRGDRIRAFNLIRFLAEHGDIYLGSLADEAWEDSQIQGLETLCAQVRVFRLPPKGRWFRAACGFAMFRSATEGAFHSPELQAQVKRWAQEPFDAAVVFCSSMGQYVSSFQKATRRLVVDFVDVDSQKWADYAHESSPPKKWLYQIEARRVAKIETELTQVASACLVVSPEEAEIFRSWHPDQSVLPLSNGVDHEYFSPGAIPPERVAALRVSKPQLVFVGVLDYFPNVNGLQWFCSEVLPLLRERFPGLGLDIVGRNPNAEVVALGRLPGVRVVGPVDDVRPYIFASDIAIAPLRIARGIQNKVLEALACGRPVIASPQAATGITDVGGIFVANEPRQWLDQLESLQETEFYRQNSQLARNQIVEHYSWKAKLSPLLKILELNP